MCLSSTQEALGWTPFLALHKPGVNQGHLMLLLDIYIKPFKDLLFLCYLFTMDEKEKTDLPVLIYKNSLIDSNYFKPTSFSETMIRG